MYSFEFAKAASLKCEGAAFLLPNTCSMKGIDKLPHLTSGQKEDLLHSAEQYKRFARVEFEVLEVAGQNITVSVAQSEYKGGRYLSAKELKERTAEVFKGLPADTQLSIQAHPFKFLNVVTADYINQQSEALGLSHTELARLLDMRPENLTRIMEDRKGLTKLGKAAFYYLFKYLETEKV